MEALWPIVVVVGPILLAVALLWAVFRNRAGSPGDDARADAGSRKLYADEDRRSDD